MSIQALLPNLFDLIRRKPVMLDLIAHLSHHIVHPWDLCSFPKPLKHSFSLFDAILHLENDLQALLLNAFVLGPSSHLGFVFPESSIQAARGIVQYFFFDLFELKVNILNIMRSLIKQALQQIDLPFQVILYIFKLINIDLKLKLPLLLISH